MIGSRDAVVGWAMSRQILLFAAFAANVLGGSLPAAADQVVATKQSGPPPAAPTALPKVDLTAYRAHLAALIALVDRCGQSIDLAHCDSKQVGADDTIVLFQKGGEKREMRYDWLRETLTRAVAIKQAAAIAKPPSKPAPETTTKSSADQSVPKSGAKSGEAKPAVPAAKHSTSTEDAEKPDAQTLLAAARLHLLADQQAVQQGPAGAPDHHTQRQQIGAILAQQEFDQVEHPSAWDRAVEGFWNWVNNLFSRIPSPGHSHWIQWLVEWGIVLATSTALVWWLIQGSKRERWRLESSGRPPAGAPSLRDWQLWLAEAEIFAQRGQWREAVHNVYWAAISRLESRGYWPVDRARTPSEYLALITAADPRRQDLTTLTRSFERIWYGYRYAAETEYQSARELLEKLAS